MKVSQLMICILGLLTVGLVTCQTMPAGMEMNKPDKDLKKDLKCFKEIQVQLLTFFPSIVSGHLHVFIEQALWC
jgi:hypothetical protein